MFTQCCEMGWPLLYRVRGPKDTWGGHKPLATIGSVAVGLPVGVASVVSGSGHSW